MTATPWTYDAWIRDQAEKVEHAMRAAGRRGVFTASLFVKPSAGPIPGDLIFSAQGEPYPPGMLPILDVRPHGRNIMSCPYSHITSILWRACRSEPICPTEDAPAAAPQLELVT